MENFIIIFIYFLADFKSGKDKKRCKSFWPTPIDDIQLIVKPIDTVQNEVRANGLGSMLKHNMQ